MFINPQTPEGRFSPRVLKAYANAGLPPLLAVRQASADQPAEILLYDEVGPYGISAKDFAVALAKIGSDQPVTVRINSPGGWAYDGLAIYTALRNHPGGVNTVVDGLAASAASIIAMAGNKIEMHETGTLMIHNAHVLAVGNKKYLEQVIKSLSTMDTQMAEIYHDKSAIPFDELDSLMDAETEFRAQEALNRGFVDQIITPPKRTARAMAGVEVLSGSLPEPEIEVNPELDAIKARIAAMRAEMQAEDGKVKSEISTRIELLRRRIIADMP